MKFAPTQDFYCPELESHYLAALSYTVRPGNDELRTCLEQWLGEGKVRVIPEAAGSLFLALIAGAGIIK